MFRLHSKILISFFKFDSLLWLPFGYHKSHSTTAIRRVPVQMHSSGGPETGYNQKNQLGHRLLKLWFNCLCCASIKQKEDVFAAVCQTVYSIILIFQHQYKKRTSKGVIAQGQCSNIHSTAISIALQCFCQWNESSSAAAHCLSSAFNFSLRTGPRHTDWQ